MLEIFRAKVFGLPAWGLLNLLVIYIVWSSTYLAMSFMVDPVNGLPPFLANFCRLLPAGLILLLIASWRGSKIFLSAKRLTPIIISGILLWLCANSCLLWALHLNLDSGMTAVLGCATPILANLFAAVAARKAVSMKVILALLIATAGILIINVPQINGASGFNTMAILAMLLYSVFWAAGSVIQARASVDVPAIVISGWQQLVSSFGLVVLSLATGEHLPATVSPAALWGLAYLIVVASIFAYSSYIIILKTLPMSVAMTYCYVNPVFALLLGWWLNNEQISGWTALGAAITLFATWLIVAGSRRLTRRPEND